MLLFGRTTENDARTLGIALFQLNSAQEAQRIMDNDPVVIHGVMTAPLHPFRIKFMKSIKEEE